MTVAILTRASLASTEQRYSPGDQVRHERFGIGEVRADAGMTLIVRFADGIHECEKADLSKILTPLQAIDRTDWDPPLEVIARVQAEAIQSTNDTWGVFSRSRIQLLPHQLWVCKRVLERWPARWLVADDVGLGKTIEAGLILLPLLSRGTVQRLLILCPAALVPQWQQRLLEMFDIRLMQYLPELDTPRSDFWGGSFRHYVIASLETLRLDNNGRHQRLLESEPWDLVVVDEAHHLNADEHSGPTLGYSLLESLMQRRRVDSAVFFTGTPHRGKDYGFWSLLQLLRPDLFDPTKPRSVQLPLLREVMIRNNKQNVTDLSGKRLFQAPRVESRTYSYSEAEDLFYRKLTDFITRGEAYASSLTSTDGKAVILLLIAMQKLAASSVAAIRRALNRRLDRILKVKQTVSETPRQRAAQLSQYEEAEAEGDIDQASRIEETLLENWPALRLMLDEESRLRELIAAADEVKEETKITEILRILNGDFRNQPVLLFTEYKATQSLVMSALTQEFGDGCVAFINGDERADDVFDKAGNAQSIRGRREDAAFRFNSGAVRFLVSTEAGGEGIDLQERCHTLIHVDLPWNPMRLHQRVGRLNRYGQTQRVDVVQLHNPATVESLIWEKLNIKIATIMEALREAMDEPEDLLELVLGMTSSNLFAEVFTEARSIPQDSLSDWFDRKTAQFGGRDALETVRDLVGYASRFDYQEVSAQIPRIDLPALKPFFRAMLTLNGRQVREEEAGISFLTPELWAKEPGVLSAYEGLVFDRTLRGREVAPRVMGVGHRVFDQALSQARKLSASVASVPSDTLTRPLLVYSISDRVTTAGSMVRSVIVGVEYEAGEQNRVLRDWELLEHLNILAAGRGVRRPRSRTQPANVEAIHLAVASSQETVQRELPYLDLPFRMPTIVLLVVLWPSIRTDRQMTEDIVGELEDEP